MPTTRPRPSAFDKPLAAGSYTLSTDYTGVINTQANGLFALDYQTDSGKQRALYTQFENSDARRFIPSWDEPNFKATFDLTVNAPAGQMVVSNMPVASAKATGNGMQQVVFETSPKMSTYLLFLGMGEFDRATLDDNGVEIGVIAQKGKVDQAQFALEASRDVLREYNDYFGVEYPLPKLDNIAAPGRSQFFSAMENWGAIFTFESSLLLDPRISNVSDQQRVFTTAAHEIAHQWFGDLVTMAWWDDLWLNEGFATWMEGRTTQKLHPEWDIDNVDAAYTSRGAMGGDAYATTHPVVQHVATVEQASQAFDGITYGKGSAVIGMLEDYVGSDAWRDGVRSYIKQHAYGNAVTDDLWSEVDKAAPGKQFIQVAHDFTLQPGIPLITASARCDGGQDRGVAGTGRIHDRSSRQDAVALACAGQRAQRRQHRARAGGWQGQRRAAGLRRAGVVERRPEGLLPHAVCAGAVQGVERWLHQAAGGRPAGRDDGCQRAVPRWACSRSRTSLDLTTKVPLDASPNLWQMVAGTVGGLDDMFEGNPKRQAAARKYALSRLSPKFQQLGWENREGDSATTKQLRSSLIGILSTLGDDKVLAEARARFAASATDPKAMPPELRRTILGIVARNADAATWDKLHKMAQDEKSSMIRDQYYGLLAAAKDKALAQRALDMALTDEPGATNSAGMISSVSREHSEMAFDFAVAHREQVDKLVDSTSRARYYPGLGYGAKDLKMVDKIKAFADAYIAPTSRRDAETVMNGIQTRFKLRAQRMPQIDAWLKKNGY